MTLRRLGVATLLATALVVPIALQTAAVARSGYLAGDFRAFYCAARIARARADPYLAAPLDRCERSAGPSRFFARHPGLVIPAPLPGYALAMIAPLTYLPFVVAAALWMLLMAASTALCIVVLRRLSGFALPAIVAAIALPIGMTSLPFGENIPLAIAALCLSAWFASRERWRAAGLAAAVAMIEPQLALPACLSLIAWARGSRTTLITAAILSALASLWLLGSAANLEYFARVLPAQALSEASRDTQYSLSSILIGLGLRDAIALRIGQIEYVVMLFAGLFVGRLLARRYADGAFFVLVPPALVVMGGAYLHITQIAAAIPAALVLLAHTRQYRAILLAGLALLAVPWLHAPLAITASVAPVALLVWQLGGKNPRATLVSALLAALALLGLSYLSIASQQHRAPQVRTRFIDRNLPQASWSRFTQLENSTGSVDAWAARIPTWTGLLLLAFVAVGESGAISLRRIASTPKAMPPEGVATQ